MESIQSMSASRTSPESSRPIKAKTSARLSKTSARSKAEKFQFLSLKKESGNQREPSWETGTQWLGGLSMRYIGEHPSVDVECTLSSILQTDQPNLARYCLSKKACQGILRRSRERGKTLPDMLREALEEVVNDGEEGNQP